ncbi:cytochrome P450 [Actinomycetospora chlora]|uniref:Cytochrome P450 n=1 Tax=Actinomycetospora chlora TaxID=663608 RepID=A0ABP9BWR6_9PSEU
MTTLPLDRPDPVTPPGYADLAPVARVTAADGGPAWLVTAYDLVAAGLTDPRLGLVPPGVTVDERASLFRDGPEHDRLRRLVARAFTARRVERLRPRVEAIVRERVAALVAAATTPGAPVDLVDVLAAPLAVATLGELLGVTLHERFRVLVEDALGADLGDPGAERVWGALTGFTAELVAAARAEPREDLLSALVAVRDAEDGRLSDGELVALVTALLAAGVLTVRSGLAVAVVHLLRDGALAGLAERPGAEVAAVVEDLVRRMGVEVFPRWAQQDLELGGVAIAAGERVLLRIEAANHDPARTGPHLGFGRGPHHCLGAALARLEVTAALVELSRAAPGLRLAVPLAEVPWHRGEVDSGPLALPVLVDG